MCQLLAPVCLAILLVAVAAAPILAGRPGDLDPTFAGDGRVTTDFAQGVDRGFAVALQSDGKVLVAGRAHTGSDHDFGLARYNSNGSLDTSFGTGGLATTDFAGSADYGRALALQSDGKIVVAGRAGTGGDDDFALARYTISGTLDASFGTGGLVTTDFAGEDDRAYGLALQPDGKILAAGYAHTAPVQDDFALARYTISGTLDTTFGTDGIVTTTFSGEDDRGYGLALQPDGKIVVAGYAYAGLARDDFALARYTITGTLDTTFGTGGLVTTSFTTGDDHGHAVILQPDGRIVVAGYAPGAGPDFALARYTITGTLDTTFGTGGLVTTDFANHDDRAYGLTLQSDGKIVAAGHAETGITPIDDFALARYYNDGSPDSTFGTGGRVTVDFAGQDSGAYSVALQPDGRMVAAGYAHTSYDEDFALARLNTLGIAKAVSEASPLPGQRITYTISVTNSTSFSLTHALISDTLPSGLSLVGPVTLDPPTAGIEGAPPTLVSSLKLSAGQGVTVAMPVTVELGLAGGTAITNTAWLTSSQVVAPVVARVTITVANAPPVAQDDGGTGFATHKDTAFTTGSVLTNDSDPNGDALSVASLDDSDTVGQVTKNHDGTFGYDPDGQFDVLLPGQQATDTFAYTVTDGAAHGGPLTDSATVTITITGGEVERGVALAPDQVGTAAPGTTITYTHTLTNTGNLADTFDLSHTSSRDWAVAYGTPIALSAGQTATLIVTVAVPSTAVSGIVERSTLIATSHADNQIEDTATNTTTVVGAVIARGVKLAPDQAGTAAPGTTITYTHTLTNTGNVPDTFDITHASHQGWTVTHGTPIALGAGQTTTLGIVLTVPSTATNGTVDSMVITATSKADEDAYDRVTDRTTVVAGTWWVHLPVVLRNQ
jgi:uncharacterized delta-60 repeat protein/uncharacterized repeat protein (TIGR01451 family)